MDNATTIYIELLDEDVAVWRPVQAEHVGGDLYKLTEEQPDDEVWPFSSGDVVRCQTRSLSGDSPVLVAYQKSA